MAPGILDSLARFPSGVQAISSRIGLTLEAGASPVRTTYLARGHGDGISNLLSNRRFYLLAR